MRLTVGRRPDSLPPRPCLADEVRTIVDRSNPPFVVHTPEGKQFSARRRVFLSTDAGVRVECENRQELEFACRLSAEEHNAWQIPDETHHCVEETAKMEAAIQAQPPEESDDEGVPREEEDITMNEWSQMGYKWFRKEDVLYI